ncbi:MAG: MATE family efflux transporter [Eubacterium sp.]|nr:MATE family efflux transporter [Eubacterium sp.]
MQAEEIFGKGSVWKAIAKMSIPAVATMLVMIIYNMADMYFVGKTGEPAQIAAISLASPVYMLMMAVGTLVGGGGCASISKALGEKNYEYVKSLSGACLVILTAISIIFSGAVLLFPDAILSSLGTDTDTWQYTREYLTVLAVGMISIVFSSVFANVIRAEGAAKESMIGNAIGTLTNLILDPIFILVLGMGVMGAAIATVIGNAAASVFFIFYICRSKTELTLNPLYALKKPKSFLRIIVLGVPNAVSNLLSGMSNTISNHILIQYGAGTIAAIGVGGKAGMIVHMILMGICMGVQPVIAYNYGAGDRKRTKEVLAKIAAVSLTVGAVLTMGCYYFRPAIARMFLDDAGLLEQSIHIMTIQLSVTAFSGLYYIGMNFLQAAGSAMPATILSVFRQGLMFIPTIYIMHSLFQLEGVYWVQVICDAVSILLALILMIRQFRRGFIRLQDR